MVWFLVTWFFLVAVVCALFYGWHFYHQVDERLRDHVETLLAEQYPGVEVKVGSARLIEREGFRIRGVSFLDASPNSSGRDLGHIDEILVRCRPTLDDLLRGRVEVAEVIVRQPRVRCVRNQDGSWSFKKLAKLPKFGGRSLPTVLITDGTLEVLDPSRQPSGLYTLRDIQVRVQPALQPDASSRIEFQIAASFTGDHLQRSQLRAVVDQESRQWQLEGEVAGLSVTPNLGAALPIELAKHLQTLGDLQARTDFTFQAHQPGNKVAQRDVRYLIQGTVQDGRLSDPALSLPLTDLAAEFTCNNDSTVVSNVTGRFGAGVVRMSCERPHDPDSPAVVAGRVENVRLDPALIDKMPPIWRQAWEKFQPRGGVSADFRFTRLANGWDSDVRIECHDLGFTWKRFPYPVEATTGTIHWRAGQVAFDLVSKQPRQPIRLRGEVSRPGPRWYGWFDAVAKQAMALDDHLIRATSAKTQKLVRAFHPQGLVSFDFRVQRKPDELEPDIQLDATVMEGRIRHDKFPYPLHTVSGKMHRRNDHWTFEEITGANDSARVACHGEYRRDGAESEWQLHFSALDLPLEEELRLALTPSVQDVWKSLQPQGSVDHVAADLVVNSRYGPKLTVTLQENAAQDDDRARRISLRPRPFPCRMDQVTGVVVYENGDVRFRNVRGNSECVRMAAEGNARIGADRRWSLDFDHLTLDHIRADSEFVKALPPALRNLLTKTKFAGRLWIDGALSLSGIASDPLEQAARWRLLVDMEDASLDLGTQLEHVSGQVTLQGESHGQRFGCRGRLDLDSLMTKGTQLTNLRGPIWIDQNHFLAGTWAAADAEGARPAPVVAEVHGGTLNLSSLAKNDDLGSCEVACRLYDADLAAIQRQQQLRAPVAARGRVWADLRFRGNRQGRHALRGNGSVQLRDTNFYELPFFLALFKTMRTGSTDRTAFNAGDAKFRLQGDHIYFDSLDLKGDALTMKGVGEMSWDRDVKLDFYTVVGREDAYFPAIRPLLGMASRRFLVVKVTGKVEQPQMSREVLPGLNDTLRQLFPEIDLTDSVGGVPEPSETVVSADGNSAEPRTLRQVSAP